MYGLRVDRHERTEGAETDLDRLPPDTGYRARARLGQTGVRRVRIVIAAIVMVIGAGIAFSIGGSEEARPSASPGSVVGTSSPRPSASRVTPTPAPLPAFAILGSPPPTRPVPLGAGWLRWLDPVTGDLGGDAGPAGGGESTLTFVDSGGRAVQLCTSTEVDGASFTTDVNLCMFDERGTEVGRDRIATLTSVLLVVTTDAPALRPVQLDATVSRDGRWLWFVSAVRGAAAWTVDLWRVDLRTRTLDGSREARLIPITRSGRDLLTPDDWLVRPSTSIWPVVRASPNGSQLSVTLTAITALVSETGLIQQERLVLDSALDPTSPIMVALPVRETSDLACSPSSAAFATERHYLSICRRPEANGDSTPFVRVESPDDMIRDVAVGPVIRAEDGMIRDSSWLLDAGRGILYRWSPVRRTLTRLDVATRAGTTVILDPQPGPAGADWPTQGVEDGLMVWSHLDQATDQSPGPQLAGSADGRVLYALGLLDRPSFVAGSPPRSMMWVLDAESLSVIDRWDPPGPVDQIALAPGGGPLIEISPPMPGSPDSPLEFTTALWFVDQTTGDPLEVLGQLPGPGGAWPILIQPSVQALAGF